MNAFLIAVWMSLASTAHAQDAWKDIQSMAGKRGGSPVQAGTARGGAPLTSRGTAVLGDVPEGVSTASPSTSVPQSGAAPADDQKPKDPFDALRERIARDMEARPLFIVTESDHEGKLRRYLVVRSDQLEKPFLFNSTIERGPGKGFILSTVLDDTFLASFLRAGDDKLLFVRRQLEHRADAGTPELRAIQRTVQDDVLALVPVVASDTAAGYLVVSAEHLFVHDLTQVGLRLQEASEGKMLRFAEEASFLHKISAFPENIEVQVQLAFEIIDPARAAQLAEGLDAVLMRYSLSALPEDPGYEPRAADPRVGYFRTQFRDLSRPGLKDKADPRVHLINRWNLQKKEPDAPVSDVVEPVVFWLEDTVPHEYRDAVRKGILAWNAAFEAAGLRNALVVKQVPAPGEGNEDMTAGQRVSFDPADISYNLVRWFVQGFGGAVGPRRANPLTGQIFHAVISVSDSMPRGPSALDLVAPGNGPGAARGAPNNEARFRERARRDAALALALTEVRGPLGGAGKKRLIQEFLTEILAHETGHTLGLEHNFKGSQLLRQEELGRDGLFTSSVMDYKAAYLAPPGKPQGAYYQSVVGPYDRWAIEYGYKPIAGDKKAQAAELKGIASKSDSDPRLAYGSDRDLDTDVDAQTFDLGQGALPFARTRVELAQALWKQMAAAPAEPGEDNIRLRERFAAGFGAYFNAVEAVLPLIGGQRTRRGSGRQFEPVPASEQRQALKFIEENVFAAEPFKASPELLQRLGNDRLSGSDNTLFPITSYVSALQHNALAHIYSFGTLQDLARREADSDPGGRFSASELFDRVRRSVWSELSNKKSQPIHIYRRGLQVAHLTRLIRTMDSAAAPSDASGAARRDLERIARDAKKAVGRQRDESSRLHLSEVLRRAQEALDPMGRGSHRAKQPA